MLLLPRSLSNNACAVYKAVESGSGVVEPWVSGVSSPTCYSLGCSADEDLALPRLALSDVFLFSPLPWLGSVYLYSGCV